MQSVLELLGWFVFNVAIPLLAPLALLPLMQFANVPAGRHGSSVRLAIKDGQLLWAVIPLSASACYMLASALEEAWALRQVMWGVMTAHVLVIVVSSVLVMLATRTACLRDALWLSRDTDDGPMLRTCVFLSVLSGGMHFLGYVFLIRPVVTAG
ncbi:hypothetical protein [Cupriavidus agavae]|uniref:DUF4149 domain-containing protein n=1 Tax=Cupriavidus agavae TaxID=1001822 RepID=A0A4Q7S8Z0_9BURK|nr:hypothetical protein [Cupriavidus agavae]RZT42240.1 hypothetical protein EV147_1263 [Cupriavidus agavae]